MGEEERAEAVTLVELCAGTAAVSLWALGRRAPLTGFMGGKRRWAAALVHALEVDRPDRVVLVDAGPWGDAWASLRSAETRCDVADMLETWACHDLEDLWRRLVAEPPSPDAPLRVAQFLWLQARSAGCIPVWWSGERWESPTGSRTEAAHTRGGAALANREKGYGSREVGAPNQRGSRGDGPAYQAGGVAKRRAERGGAAAPKGCRGIQIPTTIARRLRALDALPWDRIEVVHGDVRSVAPIPGARVYFDPPYHLAPRYAALLPRADVVAVAQRWADNGCRVAVSEREAIEIPDWTARRLADREIVTASWPIRLPEQLGLFA